MATNHLNGMVLIHNDLWESIENNLNNAENITAEADGDNITIRYLLNGENKESHINVFVVMQCCMYCANHVSHKPIIG